MQKKIEFARPLKLEGSLHDCVPIDGIVFNDLIMKKESRYPFDVAGDTGQDYRQVGFIMEGTQKVAVVVQKQRGIIPNENGSYRLLFNGTPTKRQNRQVQDVVKAQL